jgi:stalled ribosome rescue protein Dom34
MAFKALFIAKSPDADRKEHRSIIESGKSVLHSVLVKNLEEAKEECRTFVKTEQIDAIVLCPGFTHSEVADIVKETDGKVSVSIARGDGPGSKIIQEVFKREGF